VEVARLNEAGVGSSSSGAAAPESKDQKDTGTAVHGVPSHFITQEEASEEQRLTGTKFPWANVPAGWEPEIPEDDNEPGEQHDVVDNPWVPSKQVES
jgi:hypothetical protein